jgi:hypothetical protein
MHIRYWLILGLAGIALNVHADHAEVYLGDEALQGRYAAGADLIGLRAGELAAELFINEQDDLLGTLSLDFTGRPAGTSPWTFTAGPKVYGATLDVDDDNFLAVAPGVKATYAIDTAFRPIYLAGQFYYAPEILTTGDADDLTDFIIRAEMDFIERVTGFVGYRLLEADLEDGGDHDLDDDIHIGVRFVF